MSNRRPDLRTEIEKRNILAHEDLLVQLRAIKESVNDLSDDFLKINDNVSEMVQNFSKSKSESQHLLEKCTDIFKKRYVSKKLYKPAGPLF